MPWDLAIAPTQDSSQLTHTALHEIRGGSVWLVGHGREWFWGPHGVRGEVRNFSEIFLSSSPLFLQVWPLSPDHNPQKNNLTWFPQPEHSLLTAVSGWFTGTFIYLFFKQLL